MNDEFEGMKEEAVVTYFKLRIRIQVCLFELRNITKIHLKLHSGGSAAEISYRFAFPGKR